MKLQYYEYKIIILGRLGKSRKYRNVQVICYMLYVICHVAIPDVVIGDTVIELCRFVRTPHYKYKYDVLVLHYQKISNYTLVTLLSRSSYSILTLLLKMK